MVQIKKSEIQQILITHYKEKLQGDLFRIFAFEQKYSMSITDFKESIATQKEEDFEKWDDLIEWEALVSFSKRGYRQLKELEDGFFEITE